MTTKEYILRLIVIDGATVALQEGDRWQFLDPGRARAALKFLGLNKDPVTVPNRTSELAIQDSVEFKLSGLALKAVSLLAEYNEPLTVHQLTDLLGTKPNSTSARVSVLKTAGLLHGDGQRPQRYMVTPLGHAALLTTAKEQTDGE